MKKIFISSFFLIGIFHFVIGQTCDPFSGCFGPNLVTDGDFEAFNPGIPFASFSNNYPYNGVCIPNQNNCGGFLCQGEFAVETGPFPCNPGFSNNIVDHTFSNGTGNMMIVDFSNNASLPIWCQTITLAPNTEYCFGAWLINLLPFGNGAPLPVFRFEINGNVLGIGNGIPENEQWQFEGYTFNSGAGGLAEFCILNHNFGAIGFDLGIDDISIKEVNTGSPPLPETDFASVCTNGEPVEIDVLSNDLPGANPLDFSTLSISSAPPFSSGSITDIDQVNGTVTFVPDGSFGVTTFFYEICDTEGCCASGEVQVTRFPSIQASWTTTDATCADPQSGSITLTVSGGSPPFTYDWDNAPDVQNPIGLSTGIYALTISDSSGCTKTLQAIVNGPPTLTINLLQQDISCNGFTDGTLEVETVGGEAPFAFDWDILPDGPLQNNLGSNTYNVTVTDSNGCEATAMAIIPEPAVLTISTIEDVPETCPGQNDGQGSAIGGGGTSPYQYLWSNGSTLSTIGGVDSGNYEVTITDSNGCTEVADLSISALSNMMLTISGMDAACFGVNDGTATAVPTNGTTPYSFEWSNGASVASISNLIPGNYFVTVTDALGCTITSNQVITELMPVTTDLTSTDVSCFGGNDGSAQVTILTGAAPVDFIWDSGLTTSIITGLSSGTHYISITDAAGCFKLDSITVEEASSVLDLSIDPNDPSCYGSSNGSIAVNVSGGLPAYTFSWNNGMTTDSLSGLSEGIFSLTVTDQSGCEVIGSASLSQPGALTFEFTSIHVTCFEGTDGSITIDTVQGGVGPYLFSLNGEDFQTSTSFTGLGAGNYSIFVRDLNECEVSASTSIVQPPPITVQLGEDITLELGDRIELNNSLSGIPGFSYQWSPEVFLSCSNCPRPVVFPFESTDYQLIVTDTEGCTATDNITVFVNKTFDVFIPNAFSPNDDGWNDVFMIFGGKSVTFVNQFVVFDRWGELVFEARNFPPDARSFGWDGRLKGRKLSPGVFVYFAEIQFLDGTVLPVKGDVTLLR